MESTEPYQMDIPQCLVLRMGGAPQLLALLFLHSTKIHQIWGGDHGNHQFVAKLHRNVGNLGIHYLWLASEVELSL